VFTKLIQSDPVYRRFYYFAVAGFLFLSVGYLLRERINQTDALSALFLGIFPNLFGSFATPFALVLLLASRYPGLPALRTPAGFALINLFTMAVVLLIEYGHVLFGLGAWDWNDILASLAGGLAAFLFFVLSRRETPSSSTAAERSRSALT
jgi:hypothetical protein